MSMNERQLGDDEWRLLVRDLSLVYIIAIIGIGVIAFTLGYLVSAL